MAKVNVLETTTFHGHPVCVLEMRNEQGSTVRLTNYGARIMQVCVPDRRGVMGNVVVGYPGLEGFLTDTFYMGAIIGRVANRIKKASFSLDGKTYHLCANDGPHCNHGGPTGFHAKVWRWEVIPQGVRFTLSSPDGEGGWPGNLDVAVEYGWSENNVLSIRIEGESDRPTYFNPTCHAYFNLSATQDGNATATAEDVLAHELQIPFHRMIDTDRQFIPTGKILEIEDTLFDFQTFKPIGRDIFLPDTGLQWNRGYNHCYIAKTVPDARLIRMATLRHQVSGRTLEVRSTLPGVLVYSAGYHDKPHCAVCFETQYWPDYMHHSHFPQSITAPDSNYFSLTEFRFSAS
jgi:aldose 1-epimerase